MNQNNCMNAGRTEQGDDEIQGFRVCTLKIFGGIQIGVGAACAVLSLVGIIINGVNIDCDGQGPYFYKYVYRQYIYNFYNYNNCPAGILLGFDTTCLIFSGWCLLTGLLPFCMTTKRRNSWRCLKTAYMICCIIGAAVFMPTIFSLGVVESVNRWNETNNGLAAIPAFLALFGLVEMIVAIVASAFCCCCSSWGSSYPNRMVYITTNNPGMIITMAQTQITNPQIQVPLAHPGTFQTTNNQSFRQARQQYYWMPAATFSGAATDQQPQNGNSNPPP